jgi:hypothetical protein
MKTTKNLCQDNMSLGPNLNHFPFRVRNVFAWFVTEQACLLQLGDYIFHVVTIGEETG